MNIKNERFYRVGDWDGKEHEKKKKLIKIFSIKVYFKDEKDFRSNFRMVESAMEQVLDQRNIKCESDEDNTLTFLNQHDTEIFKETSRQLNLIKKGCLKRLKRLLKRRAFAKIENDEIKVFLK